MDDSCNLSDTYEGTLQSMHINTYSITGFQRTSNYLSNIQNQDIHQEKKITVNDFKSPCFNFQNAFLIPLIEIKGDAIEASFDYFQAYQDPVVLVTILGDQQGMGEFLDHLLNVNLYSKIKGQGMFMLNQPLLHDGLNVFFCMIKSENPVINYIGIILSSFIIHHNINGIQPKNLELLRISNKLQQKHLFQMPVLFFALRNFRFDKNQDSMDLCEQEKILKLLSLDECEDLFHILATFPQIDGYSFENLYLQPKNKIQLESKFNFASSLNQYINEKNENDAAKVIQRKYRKNKQKEQEKIKQNDKELSFLHDHKQDVSIELSPTFQQKKKKAVKIIENSYYDKKNSLSRKQQKIYKKTAQKKYANFNDCIDPGKLLNSETFDYTNMINDFKLIIYIRKIQKFYKKYFKSKQQKQPIKHSKQQKVILDNEQAASLIQRQYRKKQKLVEQKRSKKQNETYNSTFIKKISDLRNNILENILPIHFNQKYLSNIYFANLIVQEIQKNIQLNYYDIQRQFQTQEINFAFNKAKTLFQDEIRQIDSHDESSIQQKYLMIKDFSYQLFLEHSLFNIQNDQIVQVHFKNQKQKLISYFNEQIQEKIQQQLYLQDIVYHDLKIDNLEQKKNYNKIMPILKKYSKRLQSYFWKRQNRVSLNILNKNPKNIILLKQ